MALTFFIIAWLGGFLTLGLIARFLGALFSQESSRQIREYPSWHLVWIIVVFAFLISIFGLPVIASHRRLKGQLETIRQNTWLSVNQAGGWSVLRTEAKSLSEKTQSGNSFYWYFETRENPELTNSYPIIAKLHPYKIWYSKNPTDDGYMFVQVYFTQWGGGRGCTRYYDLILTPTNRDELPSSFVRDGDRPLKLTNSVYELTWHFY